MVCCASQTRLFLWRKIQIVMVYLCPLSVDDETMFGGFLGWFEGSFALTPILVPQKMKGYRHGFISVSF
jgi:hypothetical protein